VWETVFFLFGMRLFQNFSFWNSNLRFRRKSGHLTAFPRGCFKTNRVLEQPRIFEFGIAVSKPVYAVSQAKASRLSPAKPRFPRKNEKNNRPPLISRKLISGLKSGID
jgi:hypothetical protein